MMALVTGCLSVVVGVDGTEPVGIGMAARRCLGAGRSVSVLLLTRVLEWLPLMLLQIPLEVLRRLRTGLRLSKSATRTCGRGECGEKGSGRVSNV